MTRPQTKVKKYNPIVMFTYSEKFLFDEVKELPNLS